MYQSCKSDLKNYKLSCQGIVRVQVWGGRRRLILPNSLGEVWPHALPVQMRFCRVPFFPKGDLRGQHCVWEPQADWPPISLHQRGTEIWCVLPGVASQGATAQWGPETCPPSPPFLWADHTFPNFLTRKMADSNTCSLGKQQRLIGQY